jgi:AraC family transcriptional regulator
MNACTAPNVLGRKPSNRGSKPERGLPTMNAVEAAYESSITPCRMTETSGSVLRRRDLIAFTLIESVYPTGLTLSKHCHEHAYLAYVLSGSYTEKYVDRECPCPEGTLHFLPSSILHENDYTSGARCLLVKIESSALDRLGEHSPVLSTPGNVEGFASSWLANRLYREFTAADDVAPLAMEGVLLEILAESARAIGEGSAANAPAWLRRVRESIEDTYLQAPSLAELASIGGIHPVHLSREFRKHYHSTIGEFIRKRRIEHACKLLVSCEMALSEIALACGFADQSHFCAMFKGHTGLTPAKFRDLSARS